MEYNSDTTKLSNISSFLYLIYCIINDDFFLNIPKNCSFVGFLYIILLLINKIFTLYFTPFFNL